MTFPSAGGGEPAPSPSGPSGAARHGSAAAIIIANLVGVAMVLLGRCTAKDILLLYWLESAIVGFFNLARIALACGPARAASGGGDASSVRQPVPLAGRLGMMVFFTIHYGIFMSVHLTFLVLLLHVGPAGAAFAPLGAVSQALLVCWPAALSLFLSHLYDFFFSYVSSGEYRGAVAAEVMVRPYGRIFVMQFTIIFGAWLSLATGNSAAILALFMLVKIVAEICMLRFGNFMFSGRRTGRGTLPGQAA